MKKSRPRKKSMRVGLNQHTISTMKKPAKGRNVKHDTACRGLGIARYPSGNFQFYWFRKLNGRPTWVTVGEYPGLNVEQAREIAEGYNRKLAGWKAVGYSGRDPFKTGASTLGEIYKLYADTQLAKAKHPERARQFREYQFNLYFDGWRDRKISTITSDEIEALHVRLTDENGPVSANRAVQFLRALFGFAKKKKLWSGDSPVEVEINPEKPRERRASKEEFIRLWKALDAEVIDPDLKDFTVLALVTGARKMDLLSMHRRDIDANYVWKIPDPKTKSYRVPLIPAAVEIIDRRTRDGFVFPSKLPGSHRNSIRWSWLRLLKKAQIADLRVHDLRHSLASILADANVSPILIMSILGHSEIGTTTRVYTHLDVNPLRTVIESAYQTMIEGEAKK